MKLLIKVSRSRLKIIKIFEENVRLKALALTRVTKGLKKVTEKYFLGGKNSLGILEENYLLMKKKNDS